MVVVVLRPELSRVVVHVTDRKLRADSRDLDGHEQQKRRGAGGVLREGLIDADADLRARLHLAADQVVREDLLRQIHFLTHFVFL